MQSQDRALHYRLHISRSKNHIKLVLYKVFSVPYLQSAPNSVGVFRWTAVKLVHSSRHPVCMGRMLITLQKPDHLIAECRARHGIQQTGKPNYTDCWELDGRHHFECWTSSKQPFAVRSTHSQWMLVAWCTPCFFSGVSVFSRSYYYTVWSAIGVIQSTVCLLVCLWRCAFWLLGLVYRLKVAPACS